MTQPYRSQLTTWPAAAPVEHSNGHIHSSDHPDGGRRRTTRTTISQPHQPCNGRHKSNIVIFHPLGSSSCTPELVKTCKVIECDISDHYAFTAELEATAKEAERAAPKTRCLWKIDWSRFNSDLRSANLHDFSQCSDVDDMVNKWYPKVHAVLDRHAPLRNPRKTNRRPCLTPELISAVRQHNAVHKLLIRSPEDAQLRDHHRKLCAVARKLDRKLKNQHFLKGTSAGC
eukprot:scpid99497/ scgid25880/ 